MILGGSNCQLSAFIAAKKRGYRTVLVDYTPNPAARRYAGVHLEVSTFDIPACIQAAKKYKVDGVMTLGTDQPVLTAARVAAECGLPSLISPETALAVTDKRIMKAVLDQNRLPAAPYRLIGRNSDPGVLAGLVPPYVLKPVDSQGQRGIFKLGEAGEVFARLEETLSFSRQEEALVEEFYPSDEITVSGWVERGGLHLLTVTDRQLYEDPTHIGVCVGHRFPSVHMDLYPEIRDLSERVSAAFQIPDGPLYLQLLCGDRGLIVNELACRIGGAFEDVFIPWLTGFGLLEAVMAGALGERVSCRVPPSLSPPNNPRQVSVQLLFCESGRADYVTPLEELYRLPGVLSAGYHYAPGDELPALENATARFGHCVLTAEDGDMEERVARLYQVFRVLDPGGRNLVIPRNFAGKRPTSEGALP